MKRVTVLLVALLGLGVLAAEPLFTGPQEFDRETQIVWQNYMNEDCGVGEEGRALAAVVERKELMEPHLIVVLRRGPQPEEIETTRRLAEEQWERLERFLGGQPDLGLSLQNTVVLHSMTRKSYVERSVEIYVRKHREGAAVALVAIGSPASSAALRQVALTDSTLRPVIAAAVAHFQLRKPELE